MMNRKELALEVVRVAGGVLLLASAFAAMLLPTWQGSLR